MYTGKDRMTIQKGRVGTWIDKCDTSRQSAVSSNHRPLCHDKSYTNIAMRPYTGTMCVDHDAWRLYRPLEIHVFDIL